MNNPKLQRPLEPEELTGPKGQFRYSGDADTFRASRVFGELIFNKQVVRDHCPPDHATDYRHKWQVKQGVPGFLQVVNALKNASVSRSRSYMFRRSFLPYCFVRLDDGNFLPLNRQYKPLGMPEDHNFDYEQFAIMACPLETFDLRFTDSILIDNGQVERFWIDNQCIELNLIAWRQYIVQMRFMLRLQGEGLAFGHRLEALLSLPENSITTFGGRLPGIHILGD
jgi:hypothetical protein